MFESKSRVRAIPAKLLIEVLDRHGNDVTYSDSPVISNTSALARDYGIHLLRHSGNWGVHVINAVRTIAGDNGFVILQRESKHDYPSSYQ